MRKLPPFSIEMKAKFFFSPLKAMVGRAAKPAFARIVIALRIAISVSI